MTDDFIPFWRLLVSAGDQLRQGAEPETMEELARVLASRHPGSALAQRLAARASYVRSMREAAVDRAGPAASSMPYLL